jgi:hypothetical protein
MVFSTDASVTIGCSKMFEIEWFANKWFEQILHLPAPEKSTALFEMIPIILAAVIWHARWKRKRIRLFYHDQARLNIVNKGRSKSSLI